MSRFLRPALIATTAAADLSLTAAPAHTTACSEWMRTAVLRDRCHVDVRFRDGEHPSGGATLPATRCVPLYALSCMGTRGPISLPSIALCPPLHLGLGPTVHTR
jgi:hypothetical protein